MSRSILNSISILFCFAFSIFSVPKFPFPQQFKYRYGIMPEGVDHKAVQTVYEVWLKNYYEESGNQARIKFDEPANTVSEGIGYGMLIMVYMDNEKNNTQPKFDKLYNYYKAHLDGNGLMHWKIQGFTNNVIGSGAATDADLDVAVALIMAEKQWGDSKYLTEAKSLIEKIKTYEISGSNLLKGGDQWNAINPSYMSMVATQLFYNITNDSNWSNVQNACYQELQISQNSTTGLWPNWSQGGTGSYPGIYGFDASRTPWRLGWAYVWYNHSQAKTLCSKLIDYFSTKTNNNPGATGQMYNLDGTINKEAGGSETCIPTFLGPFTVGGMVDTKYQTWVNNGYKRLLSYNSKNDNYYNECLELLTMLLLTGNMPDLTKEQPRTTATLTVKVFPEGAGTVTINPQKNSYNVGEQVTVSTSPTNSSRYKFTGWDGDIKETSSSVTFKINYNMIITAVYKDEEAEDLVDDCEDGDGLTYLGSEWFSYTDVLDSGNSTVTPLSKKGEVLFKMTEGGYNSSKYAAKISWKLDKGNFEYDPFVGMGFELSPDAAYVDISSSTGIRFVYKGTFGKNDTCDIKIECGDVTQPGADYSYNIVPGSEWKEITITWDKFLQPWWVTKADQVPLNLKRINKIQWQIHGQTGASGELWIDDVHLLGYSIPKTKVKQRKEFSSFHNLKNMNILSKMMGNNILINFPLKQQGEIRAFIFDLSGKMILKKEVHLENEDKMFLSFDKENLQKKCFILRLNTTKGSFIQKIVF